MISIKKEKHKSLVKILFGLILVFILLFVIKNVYIVVINKSKIEKLSADVSTQQKKNDDLIAKTKDLRQKISSVKSSYESTEKIEEKLNKIFQRMSVLDYNLVLLGTKKMCIDRHILVARLSAKTEDGQKAALGILNYLGTTKQSLKDESVYFVNYTSQTKAKK